MHKSAFGKIPRPLKLLALFILVSLVHLYPLLKNFSTMLPYADNGDVRLSLAILYSNVQNLAHLQVGQVYHLPFLFPLSHTMTIGFTLFGQSLLFLPLFLLGLPNVYALYNILTIFSYLAAGFGAYLFFRELQDDETVSVLSACLYILLPFRVANIPHLNLMFNFPAAFCLFFLLRHLDHGRRADLVGLNVFLLFQFLFDLSLGFYLSVVLAFFVLIHILITRPLNSRRLAGLFLSLLPTAALVLLVHFPFLQKGLSLSPSEPRFNPGQYLPALSFYANRSYLLLFWDRIWDAWPLFPGFSVVLFYVYAFSGYVSNLREKIVLGIAVGSLTLPAAAAIGFYDKRAFGRVETMSEIGLIVLFVSLALLVYLMRRALPRNAKLMVLLLLGLLFIAFQPYPKIFGFFDAAAKVLPFLNRSRALRIFYILPLATIGFFALGFKAFLAKKRTKILLAAVVLVLIAEHARWPVIMARLPELDADGRTIYRWAESYPPHYGLLELPFLAATSNTYTFMTRFHNKHTYHGYYYNYSDPLRLEGASGFFVENGLTALKDPERIRTLRDNGLYLIAVMGSFVNPPEDGESAETWEKVRTTIREGREMGLYREVRETSNAVLVVLDDERKGADVEYPLPYFALAGKRRIQFKLRADGPTESRIYLNGRQMGSKQSSEGEHDVSIEIRGAPLESQVNRLRIVNDRPAAVHLLEVR